MRRQQRYDTLDFNEDEGDALLNEAAVLTVSQDSRQWQRIDTNLEPSRSSTTTAPVANHLAPKAMTTKASISKSSQRTGTEAGRVSHPVFINLSSSPEPAPVPQPNLNAARMAGLAALARNTPDSRNDLPTNSLRDESLSLFIDSDPVDEDQNSKSLPPPPAATQKPLVQTQPQEVPLPAFKPLHIPAGSFSIELILDNREVRSQTDRLYIQDNLITLGVKPITRSLDIGDALWVARPHDPNTLRRLGEEGTEIVLNHIVERKRLDDLISSIKDGRFQEQKFRLHRSNIGHVTYLVEDIALSTDTAQRYHDHVVSAIASSQVVDGFFVKRTRKLDHTISYLARMTRLLRRLYADEPLKLIPGSALGSPGAYQRLKRELTTPHFVTYDVFAALLSKTEALTLKDVFLKMLMCIRGVTGEKAIEIQRRWDTPRALFEAFEARGFAAAGLDESRRMKRDMVWEVAGKLVGRRKIGKTISAKIAQVWGEESGPVEDGDDSDAGLGGY